MPGVPNTPQTFNLGSGFKFQGGGGGPGGLKLEHRIGVNAPAEVIWESIYDLASWADWNPIYPKVEGAVRIGDTLTITQALPGDQPRVIRPVVLDWVPNDQLHWRDKRFGGLVRSIRYIEIETLGEENCIFSNGELFSGPLVSFIAGHRGRRLRRGFAQMGEALKARAEAAWRARGGQPTSGA